MGEKLFNFIVGIPVFFKIIGFFCRKNRISGSAGSTVCTYGYWYTFRIS